jgi:hypothetical protein
MLTLMDIWGDHGVQCRVGVGVANTYRHNCVRDCHVRMAIASDLQLLAGREPSFPVPTPDLGTRQPDSCFPIGIRGGLLLRCGRHPAPGYVAPS